MTVSGTGVDMWNDVNPQPALIAKQVVATKPQSFVWQPVGDYPAATFPMGPSAQAAVDSMIYMTTGVPVPGANTTVPGPTYLNESLILIGYSQGAISVCHFVRWCQQNRPDISARIVAVVVYGNPLRTPGFASGNEFAGWPLPANVDGVVTGGIAGPDCMHPDEVKPHLPFPVKHFWGDFVNTIGQATDLYADCPVGLDPWNNEDLVGNYETQIYNIVLNFTFNNLFAIWNDVMAILGGGGKTIDQLWAILQAVYNGGMFLFAGPNAAHYTYDVGPMISFVLLAGSETAPWGAA